MVDEKTAPVVRRIFDMVLEGMRFSEIAKTLNAENISTPGRYRAEKTKKKTGYSTDNIWLDDTMRRILRDIRYTGLLVQGMTRCDVVGSRRHRNLPKEQWHVSPVQHEAIVSVEDFEKVQNCISSSQQSGRRFMRKVYPLSGKVRCGGCGHVMERRNTKNPSYHCKHKAFYESLSCPRKGVKVSVVENMVLAALKNLFEVFASERREQNRRADERMAASVGLVRELQVIQKRISVIDNEKLAIYSRYADGEIAKEEYSGLRDAADTRLHESSKQATTLEQQIKDRTAAPIDSPFQDKMKIMRFDGRLTREVADALIDRVFVYDIDHIEIKWKFTDADIMANPYAGEKEETHAPN